MLVFTGCQVESDDSGNEPAAKISYTVKFDANGGEGKLSGDISTTAGEEFALPAAELTKTGYDFKGWCATADGTGSTYEAGAKAKDLSTENGATVTLYAKWVLTQASVTKAINEGNGEISEETINSIAAAIRENPDVKITIDLSGTTGLTKIPDGAFLNCTNLDSIVLPETVTLIGNSSFARTNLSEIIIPDSVKTIDIIAFYDSGLASVTFGSGLESIGESAFQDCCSLTKITVGNVKTIGKMAFFNCYNIEEVIFEEGVQTIEDSAFNKCRKLATVTIPRSVTHIGSYFYTFGALQTVNYGGTMAEWKAFVADAEKFGTDNDELLNAVIICTDGSLGTDAASVIKRLGEGTHTVTVTDDVSADYLAEIADAIYNKNSSGAKIILDLSGATGLTEIPDFAFYKEERWNMYALVGIVLPQSVTSIGESAFKYSSISEIVIPDSVTEIGISAFSDTPLKSVKIGAKLAKIGNLAFCSTALTSIEIPDNVTSVGTQIFQTCYSLKDVTIGKGLASISNSMFVLCSALEEIVIPEGVKSIERRAFEMCEKLKTITIPASVTLIEEYAIDDCASLADVYYGGTVAEWNALKNDGKISTGNNALFNATIHCTDDDITPTTGA